LRVLKELNLEETRDYKPGREPEAPAA